MSEASTTSLGLTALLWILDAVALVIAGALLPHVQLGFFAAAALFAAVAIITIRGAR